MKAAENAVILWQGWLDLNQRMRESKSLALPLGYTPIREKKGDRDSIPDPALFVGWVKGLEPSTPGTTIRCSNQLSYTHHISDTGTPEGTRTPDPLLRRQLLYPPELQARLERVMGIEPTRPAWKAGILPLNYTRMGSEFTFMSALK